MASATSHRLALLLVLALTPYLSAAPLGASRAIGDPDPCALVTQAEAAAALGTAAKPAEASTLQPACTYHAQVPPGDTRAADLVSITIKDESSFQGPLHSKVFTTEPVRVGDQAYYYWSGHVEMAIIQLMFTKHGSVVLIGFTGHVSGAKAKALSVSEVKARELALATHAAARLP